jgi:hypothetical protein
VVVARAFARGAGRLHSIELRRHLIEFVQVTLLQIRAGGHRGQKRRQPFLVLYDIRDLRGRFRERALGDGEVGA